MPTQLSDKSDQRRFQVGPDERAIRETHSTWIAAVDSPVMMAAISSEESAYRPDALRRLQELVQVVPDDPTLHLLFGNLYVQDWNVAGRIMKLLRVK